MIKRLPLPSVILLLLSGLLVAATALDGATSNPVSNPWADRR